MFNLLEILYYVLILITQPLNKMTTYTIVQYDITRDVMYFLGAPTPDLKTLIEDNSLSDTATKQVIQGDSSTQNSLVPASGSAFLLDFLENDVPEIDLNNAISVTLKIGIVDDTEVGDVYVICKNQDGTTTYVTKDGLTWDVIYVDILKPSKKWATMNKNCPTCLKFDFVTGSNDFNFYGNLGGSWTGGWKNGQKEYNFFLPDYSNPVTYGSVKEYIIYWRPSASYSGTDYNGNPISIVNEHKWVAVPSASVNSAFNTESFFQVTSGFSASCPTYDASPLTPPWWNFYGPKGYFLLSSATTPTPGKPCPEFSPIPGEVSWGYNCGPNGCVVSPSGSIGTYATLEQCQVSCSLATGSYWYSCTPNGCVQVPSGSAGAFVTLAECEDKCSSPSDTPSSCSCDPDTSLVTNSSFSLGQTGWNPTPSQFLPGVGSWNFSQGYATCNTQSPFSISGTSSVSLTQTNLFSLSCSYEVCFQAWNLVDSPSNGVTVDTGNYINNLPQGTGPLTTTPTAYTFTLNNVETTDLTFFIGTGAGTARVAIDNICVTLIGCPPPPPPTSGSESTGSVIPPEDCYITGSISSYVSASYDCLCPEGYTSDNNGNCIVSSSAITVFSASAGLYTPSNTSFSNLGSPQGNGSVLFGYSLNQNGATPPSYFQTIWENVIRKNFGMAQPVLYHSWSFNGAGYSSLNNPSPFFGDPQVYNTQYTFDILSSSFWYQPELGDNFASRWVAQLARDLVTGVPQTFPVGTYGIGNKWVGFGTTVNVPSSKTYYVGIIGTGALKLKLDGVTILCTSPSPTTAPTYVGSSIFTYPAYTQNAYARIPSTSSGWWGAPLYGNAGTLPAPFNTLNPYISDQIYSAFINYYFQSPQSEYAFLGPYGTNGPSMNAPIVTTMTYGGKFYSSNNLYIYPVTMSAGCHRINFEANPDYFKYCTTGNGALGGIIFDMNTLSGE